MRSKLWKITTPNWTHPHSSMPLYASTTNLPFGPSNSHCPSSPRCLPNCAVRPHLGVAQPGNHPICGPGHPRANVQNSGSQCLSLVPFKSCIILINSVKFILLGILPSMFRFVRSHHFCRVFLLKCWEVSNREEAKQVWVQKLE